MRQPREDELGRRALAAGVEGARRRPGSTRAVDKRQGLVRLEHAAGKLLVRSRVPRANAEEVSIVGTHETATCAEGIGICEVEGGLAPSQHDVIVAPGLDALPRDGERARGVRAGSLETRIDPVPIVVLGARAGGPLVRHLQAFRRLGLAEHGQRAWRLCVRS